MTRYTRHFRGVSVALAAGALLTGCAVQPEPITQAAFMQRATDDRLAISFIQEEVTGPVSLYEAMARALLYNLDARVELAERALAEHRLESLSRERLPDLVANYAYTGRENFSGATSRSLLTGRQTLEASTSSDRDVRTYDLDLSWSVLDFGLSYVRAKQAADGVLIAEENRRRVANRIAQDVRTAFWRAVSAERLRARMQDLRLDVEQALRESRDVYSQRLAAPIDTLTYQRNLLRVIRDLEELERGLSVAKVQLAALMSLRPDHDFVLEIPSREVVIQELRMTAAEMERFAMANRPELREVDYQLRINASETRAALLTLLPDLRVDVGFSGSSNSFLFNDDWVGGGAQVAWNLLNVFKIGPRMRETEAQGALLMARRMALSMAVLTQVHVSVARYSDAQRQYRIAQEYQGVQGSLTDQFQQAFDVSRIGEQDLILERMNDLLAQVQFDIAYADLQNAFANVFSSLGIDPVPPVPPTATVDELTEALEAYWGLL